MTSSRLGTRSPPLRLLAAKWFQASPMTTTTATTSVTAARCRRNFTLAAWLSAPSAACARR